LQTLLASIAVVSILTMLSLTSFEYANGSILPMGYNHSYIQVLPAGQTTEDQNAATCDFSKVYMQDLLVRNMQGDIITETQVGSQVVIEASAVNGCQFEDKPLLVLFEVRNSDGITGYLSWQNGTISSNQQVVVGSSWVAPDVPGEYEVRGFYVGCLACPMILSNVHTYKLTVLPSVEQVFQFAFRP
jgi:hypothetical protein